MHPSSELGYKNLQFTMIILGRLITIYNNNKC